jgi:hypothetical protein
MSEVLHVPTSMCAAATATTAATLLYDVATATLTFLPSLVRVLFSPLNVPCMCPAPWHLTLALLVVEHTSDLMAPRFVLISELVN